MVIDLFDYDSFDSGNFIRAFKCLGANHLPSVICTASFTNLK